MDPVAIQFVPSIRSGSFTDIGSRRCMEDEHICIDGHGGINAASYIKKHAIKLLFEEAEFPQASQVDDIIMGLVEDSVRRAFLLADLALADNCANISLSSGTTALAALVFGKLLLVANAGDCRAVLCRKGKAMEMSQDHRPIYSAELERVQQCGGYVDDGYLNGVLSVSRALGDWDMKFPCGSPSPLIAEPEFRRAVLTEDDEFLIIGCDGIWDVMSSQHAVSVVRRGLQRHDDPMRVHSGFFYAYHTTTLHPRILGAVQRAGELYENIGIIITGHSMGGAMASFCALDLVVNCGMPDVQLMTFGQPRIGNAAFASYFSEQIPRTIRLTNGKDMVPHLPPYFIYLPQKTYRHFPREVCLHDISLENLDVDGGALAILEAETLCEELLQGREVPSGMTRRHDSSCGRGRSRVMEEWTYERSLWHNGPVKGHQDGGATTYRPRMKSTRAGKELVLRDATSRRDAKQPCDAVCSGEMLRCCEIHQCREMRRLWAVKKRLWTVK